MFTPSIAKSDVFTALRSLLLVIFPGIEVVQGLGNDVPMPAGPFICITPGTQTRLGTNTESPADNGLGTGAGINLQADQQYNVQIDCYGPDSSDWANVISTVFRSPFGTSQFGGGIQILYADDPRQLPLIDGESNYTERWTVTAAMQYSPVTQVPAQFADTLSVASIQSI